jgi:hypothetical protein
VEVKFISPADIEIDEAILYYDHELPGLGRRFLQEVEMVIKRICLFPKG